METRSEQRDVVVIGSGAAGLVAALTARLKGLNVLLLEKSDRIGGTTATSGGAIWIPDPAAARLLGHDDSRAKVLDYLSANVGSDADRARWESFIEHGPEMVRFLGAHTEVKLRRHAGSPDYKPTLPGGMNGGRRLDPLPFDGRLLGRHFDELRPPLRAFTVFGGMMVSIPDIHDLLGSYLSPGSFYRSARLITRYIVDRLRWSRGTRLLLGNALAARLFRSLLDLTVPYHLSVDLVSLAQVDHRITGVRFRKDGVVHDVEVTGGVVLATGGFASGGDLSRTEMPKDWAFRSVAADTDTGEGIEMGLAAGGCLDHSVSNAGFWAPVSTRENSDGSTDGMPHFVWDRQKPGVMAVNGSGRRFVNEAISYHEFVQAMMRPDGAQPNTPAFLVCDGATLRKWGLGFAYAGPRFHRRLIKTGYLSKGSTIPELAARIGIDGSRLQETVERYNEMVATGVDQDFGKGTDAYQQHLGDTAVATPNLGPISSPPFYAIKLEPGVIGTALGLRTDALARVIKADGTPIDGLYAAGNDMASIMGGTYPGPGITLGPAMTFGFVAATHIAQMHNSSHSEHRDRLLNGHQKWF